MRETEELTTEVIPDAADEVTRSGSIDDINFKPTIIIIDTSVEETTKPRPETTTITIKTTHKTSIIRTTPSKDVITSNPCDKLNTSKTTPKKKNKNRKKIYIELKNREAYPKPLPTKKVPYVLPPYHSIYQGMRSKNDIRVFRRRYEYEREPKGQKVVYEGFFDCVISHLALESTEAIPVLLRGGVGYRHFTAIVKSKPYRELKGQVRAYCRSSIADTPQIAPNPDFRRRYRFPELEEMQDNVS